MPLIVIRQDITKMHVDAIVNAANRSLLGGGGVDGAIHRAAGPELLAECRTLGGCATGEAKLTKGYNLPARYVIHTVGPVWLGGKHGERELLASCYRNALALAAKQGCESVAFPLISAGAYGYPKDEALAVASETIQAFLSAHEMTVYLTVFGRTEYLSSRQRFAEVQAYIDDRYVGDRVHHPTESARAQLWRENEQAAQALDIELGEFYSAGDGAAMPLEPDRTYSIQADREEAAPKAARRFAPDWKRLLRKTDEGFSESLLRLIDEKGLTDAECYKRANVDRKLFSKIRSNPAYKPSKSTALAFAVALRLSLPETQRFIGKAGYALSHSSKMDIIVEYFITHRQWDVWEINQVLFDFDMPLLGAGVK